MDLKWTIPNDDRLIVLTLLFIFKQLLNLLYIKLRVSPFFLSSKYGLDKKFMVRLPTNSSFIKIIVCWNRKICSLNEWLVFWMVFYRKFPLSNVSSMITFWQHFFTFVYLTFFLKFFLIRKWKHFFRLSREKTPKSQLKPNQPDVNMWINIVT